MDRLTRPGIEAEQTAVRFMDGEVKIQDIGDKLLDLILNGPTINGIKKDTLRHLVRQLYAELKRYEDTEVDPAELTGMLRSPVYIAACVLNGAAITHERAIEIAKAEVQGRLMVLPCKVGDTIHWILEDDGKYHISPDKIIEVGSKGFFVNGGIFRNTVYDFIPWDELGKTAFLTREEAEAALAKEETNK